MNDNFQGRLIYLKSRGIRTPINEISQDNIASADLATKGEGESSAKSSSSPP